MPIVIVVVVAVVLMSRGATGGSSDGTLDDWIGALCRPGTYQTAGGVQMPDAMSDSWCVSRSNGSGIAFYTYSSRELMERYVRYGQGSYATKTDSSGVIWLIRSYTSYDGSALAPLKAFGFSVETM